MDGYSRPIFQFALREDIKDEKQFLPTKAEPNATGWDVRACMPDRKPLIVKPFEMVKIPLGFRGFCQEGWWYQLKPRSSSFAKKHMHALYGTVDETYEGELIFACQYIPARPRFNGILDSQLQRAIIDYFQSNTLQIDFGDAIGQIIPTRREDMAVYELTNEELNAAFKARDAKRGAGGFGSTGK